MLATRPLLALSIPFMLGIALSCSHSVPFAVAVGVAVAGIALVAVDKRVAVVGTMLAACAIGALRYDSAIRVPANDISRIPPTRIAVVEGFVTTDPVVRDGRLAFTLRSVAVDAHGLHYAAMGSVAVTVLATTAEIQDGDHLALTGALDHPVGLANPGSGSWAEYLARRGIRTQLLVGRPSAVGILPGGQPNPFRQAAWSIRAALLRSLKACLPQSDAAVLAGVLLGLRADLPASLLAAFVATGTIHILATAGLHVGIVYKALMSLLEVLSVHKKLAAMTTIGAIWVYDLMAGGRMAVTRAAIMASIYLLAIVVERTPDALNSLGAAAVAILAIEPTQLLESGFQTSFGAVLMIACMMPVWEKLWSQPVRAIHNRLLQSTCRRFSELAGLTLFAQLGAAPVLASAFNLVSILGSVANLIVVPILFYLIPVGLLVAISGIWLPHATSLVAHILVSPAIAVIVAVVRAFAGIPAASISVPSPPLLAIVAYYGVVVLLFVSNEKHLLRFKDEPKPNGAVADAA